MSRGEGKKGRPVILTAEYHAALRALVEEKPAATLAELRAAFVARTGVSVSVPTLRTKDSSVLEYNHTVLTT